MGSSARRTSTACYPPRNVDVAHMSIPHRVRTASSGQRTPTASGSQLAMLNEPTQTTGTSTADEPELVVPVEAVAGTSSVRPRPRSATPVIARHSTGVELLLRGE